MQFDLKTIESAALAMQDGTQSAAEEDSDDTSDESSSTDDDSDDSDNDSADEGDDESEDIMRKLTNVGRVRSKKRNQCGSRNAGKPCYFQCGYPEVLQAKYLPPTGDSADDELNTEEDGLRDGPLSDCCANNLVEKALILEHFAGSNDSYHGEDGGVIDNDEDGDVIDDVNIKPGDVVDNDKMCDNFDCVKSAPNRGSITYASDEESRSHASLPPGTLFPASQNEFGMHHIEDIVAALDDFAIKNTDERVSDDGSSGCLSSKSRSAPPSSMKCSQSSQDELATSPSRPSSSGVLSPSSPMMSANYNQTLAKDLARYPSRCVSETGVICGSLEENIKTIDNVPSVRHNVMERHEEHVTKDKEGLTQGKEDLNKDKTDFSEDKDSFESWVKSPPSRRIEMFPDN